MHCALLLKEKPKVRLKEHTQVHQIACPVEQHSMTAW